MVVTAQEFEEILDTGTDEEKDAAYNRIASASPAVLLPLIHRFASCGTGAWLSLQTAACLDDLRFFRLMVEKGADHKLLHLPSKSTLIMIAAQHSDSILHYLLQELKFDDMVNAQNFRGETALHFAMECSVRAVELLLKHGADPHIRDDEGRTPLLWAAFNGATESAKLLRAHSADLNVTDHCGMNAMHCAVDRHGYTDCSECNVGNLPFVMWLFDIGEEEMMFAKERDGRTPLDFATASKRVAKDRRMRDLLLQRYKNKIAAQQSLFSLHWIFKAVTYENGESLLPLGRLSAEHMLALLTLFVSDYPMPISTLDDDGALPLHIACRDGETPIEVIQFLVNQDPATLHHLDNHGNLPINIHTLCESQPPLKDTLALLTLFVSARPDLISTADRQTLCTSVCPDLISVVDGSGTLPLHLACQNREMPTNVIQYLVEHDTTTVCHWDNQGNLPIHMLCACRPWGRDTLALLKLFLSVSPNLISTPDWTGALPLHIACQNGARLDFIQFLVKQDLTTVHHRDDLGNLPIHSLCASQPALDAVQYLHGKHDDSNSAMNNQGRSPFMKAAMAAASMDVLWYLMKCNPYSAILSLRHSA